MVRVFWGGTVSGPLVDLVHGSGPRGRVVVFVAGCLFFGPPGIGPGLASTRDPEWGAVVRGAYVVYIRGGGPL